MCKKKSLFYWLPIICTAVIGCQENLFGPDPEPFPGQDGIEANLVDAESLVFSSKAEEEYEIAVSATTSWSAEATSEWIALRKEDKALFVTAQRNRTINERTAVINLSDGKDTVTFEASQQPGQAVVYHISGSTYDGVGGIPARAVSHNGRYVAGSSSAGVWTMDTWNLTSTDGTNTIYAEDAVFGIYGDFNAYSVTDKGYKTNFGSTPSGDMEVGYETVNGFSISYIIKNGVKSYLPAPEANEATVGTMVPNRGNLAWWISEDGKYIAGRHTIHRGQVVECGWRYNEDTGNYDWELCGEDEIVLDEAEWGERVFWVEGMSWNGRYVCGRMYGQTKNATQCPFVHDTQTGEYIILEHFGGQSASMVTDDGWISIAGTLGSSVFVDLNGDRTVSVSMADWLRDKFGLTDSQVESLGSQSGLFRARSVNPDYSAACFAYYPDDNVQAPQWSDVIVIE